ncbi:MAG: DmpA family aminopeptidase [Acidimicrobiales bacterium]
MRARELGIPFGGTPGPLNAITDVAGVTVGHVTLVDGHGPLKTGEGPVRTGVSVIVPHEGNIWSEPVFAGCHRLNGNGDMTGLEWVRESGLLTSVIGLTNTHSVGVVRDTLIRAEADCRGSGDVFWRLPVVGETWDGILNDVNGQHVSPTHVRLALRSASGGPVAEGSVGGGTGMICHGFKGGIGTSSRVVEVSGERYVVGVLVQANHGRRERLTVAGRRIGRLVPSQLVPLAGPSDGRGSIIGVVATDAPVLPLQLAALAQRVGLGVARTGGIGEHTSGDLFFAFSNANRSIFPADLGGQPPAVTSIRMLSFAYLDGLYEAVVDATEEAIVNALVGAETMVGRDGVAAHRIPHDLLRRLFQEEG